MCTEWIQYCCLGESHVLLTYCKMLAEGVTRWAKGDQ